MRSLLRRTADVVLTDGPKGTLADSDKRGANIRQLCMYAPGKPLKVLKTFFADTHKTDSKNLSRCHRMQKFYLGERRMSE